jgi:hypothetical protein
VQAKGRGGAEGVTAKAGGSICDMICGKEGLLHAIVVILLALLIFGFLYRMGLG